MECLVKDRLIILAKQWQLNAFFLTRTLKSFFPLDYRRIHNEEELWTNDEDTDADDDDELGLRRKMTFKKETSIIIIFGPGANKPSIMNTFEI